MSNVNPVGQQVQALVTAVQTDGSIPEAHKSVLNKILSFLLRLLPSVLELFVGSDGQIDPSIAETAAPNAEHVTTASNASDNLVDHPVAESLAKAVETAKAASGSDPSVIDKIFAFILKILPTILGLFSHGAPATTGVVTAGAPGVGDSTAAGGQTPGAADTTGGVPPVANPAAAVAAN